MPTLIVPGVSVETRFDVLPPRPAPSGIVGAVGIVDRPSDSGLVSVTNAAEVAGLLGPGTETTMPEAIHALANGASEVVISAVDGGSRASVALFNSTEAGTRKPALTLRTRSNGGWGNQLAVEVRGIADSTGSIVRTGIRLLLNGRQVEQFADLQVAPGMPDDLFEVLNRRSRYVVALDPGFASAVPAEGTYAFGADGDPVDVPEVVSAGEPRTLFSVLPADRVDPTGLSVTIATDPDKTINVRVFRGGLQEEFVDLTMDPDSDTYLPYVLLAQSRFIFVRLANSLDAGIALPVATAAPEPFTGGTSPDVAAYQDAIDRLADDPRIDLILASVEPTRTDAEARQIHQALAAHATTLADRGAPRIAFGSVTANEQGNLDRIRDHAAALRSRRFVLVSPAGAEGAVAGMIGRMATQDSPTFKPVPLMGIPPATYRESELNRLLGPAINLLVVQDRAGRGVVVLKGIDLTGDQISVTRVADQCVRETKAISENFIGQLNSQDARSALRQQIVATFTRLEREGALVPSTDGTDPAFLVDVYSTQLDFAQGIVRIDIAVRPVRAIDYVYATIRVKN
jgi:hypothetical protein